MTGGSAFDPETILRYYRGFRWSLELSERSGTGAIK